MDQIYQTGSNLLTEFIINKDKEYKLEIYTTHWQYMNQIIYKISSRIFSSLRVKGDSFIYRN